MKRILTVQDISCIGKCSLTVALPVISAMGIECAVLPTAVLSTHTAFKGFTFHDLTGEMGPIADHWETQGLGFDALYTGYLGSFEQIHFVEELIGRYRKYGTAVIVDPAMGDFGKLYPGFDTAFAHAMGNLCGKADVILPNITETAYMLDRPCPTGTVSEDEIKEMLIGLAALGCPLPAMTGVMLHKDSIGVMAYHKDTDTFFHYENERMPVQFHGTGDIFASAVTGGITLGMGIDEVLTLAVDYVLECIRMTMKDKDRRWYGVNFEEAIPMLTERVQNHKK